MSPEIVQDQRPPHTECRGFYLIYDGVVHPANLPSVSQINKVIRKELVMTRKKLTTIPLKSTTREATAAIDDFLTEIANIDPTTLDFFDESSVIKTTGNRNYGSGPLGQAAFEVQRYASNANFTINFLHSFSGVDFYNIWTVHLMDLNC